MKKTILPSIFIITTMSLLSACESEEKERDIPISDVPSTIINIIQNTLPGIALEEAEIKIEDGSAVYELEGKLINGKEYEIEITESGTIIKIELDD